MDDCARIPSRLKIRRIGRGDADRGTLVLFKPPATERVPAPPGMAFGILMDGIEEGRAGDRAAVRGVLWVGGAFEFVPLNGVDLLAAIESEWHVLPVLLQADYRTPRPGDLMVTATEGMGLIHAGMRPGQWGLLSMSSGTASIWRAEQKALVMPWQLEIAGEVLFESPDTGATLGT